ncbi:MAG: IPI1/TEX10 family protein [Asgard group archaeon]|nr:IPI1/TEX10 family protein [Asgard group archaeon]
MGSKRKKKEKQKDFVKAKLKVGKTAQKPDNYTDTSFKAKTISLPNQSIASNVKSKSSGSSGTSTSSSGSDKVSLAALNHQLSLTKHHSPNTRKEVLLYLQTHLPANPSYYKNIMTSILPLILDEDKDVRKALMELISAIAAKQPGLIDLHLRSMILFILSAMSHIVPNIRTTSTHFLKIVVENSHGNLLNSYFVKVMRNYFVLMGWSLNEQDSALKSVAITNLSLNAMNAGSKIARVGHLQNLNKFLLKSLQYDDGKDSGELQMEVSIHPQSYRYLLNNTIQPYQPLKLFVNEFKSDLHNTDGISMLDLNSISTEDLDTRKKIMNDVFKPLLIKNLNAFVKEGGDIGREANNCISIINETCIDKE